MISFPTRAVLFRALACGVCIGSGNDWMEAADGDGQEARAKATSGEPYAMVVAVLVIGVEQKCEITCMRARAWLAGLVASFNTGGRCLRHCTLYV